MQKEITFAENVFSVKAAEKRRISPHVNPLEKFQRFTEESNWDEKLLGWEKYLNRFCLIVITLSVLYFIPVCLAALRG